MLLLLHIENIAVIERADITFQPGFNALTGETGAGKSIVIDAMGAVLGQRVSRDLVRTGKQRASVSAMFSDADPSLEALQEYGIVPDEDGMILLQRDIQADGKSVCRINGRPCTAAQLRQIGTALLNIHGQHDGQQLLDPASHLGYLDRCGGHTELLENYRTAYQTWNGLRKQIAALEMDEAERGRRVDTLNFQIRELERAQLRAGEDEELDQRRTLLRSAGKLMDALQSAEYALCGDDEGGGVCSLLADAEGELDSVSQFSAALEELARQVSELRSAADDAADTLRDLTREMEFSPGELD